MNKKLFCIVMCLFMLVMPILSSCGAGDDSAETGDGTTTVEEVRKPMTLSLWIPTNDTTTDDAVKRVETEINKLTQAKYDTAIELHAVKSSEYQEVIDAKIKAIDDVKQAAAEAKESQRLQEIEDAINCVIPEDGEDVIETEALESDTGAVETEVNEFGQKITIYPEVADDQLDIFLIKGYDKYLGYVKDELVEALDTDLNDVGKKLYSYIYPTFFTLAKYEGQTYCVPNNHALGKYQLLLVNKELVEQYDYDPDELTTFLDCEDFINDIGSQNLPGVTPLLGKVDAANMVYFSNDGNWSIIGGQIKGPVTNSEEAEPASVLQTTDFRPTFCMMTKLLSKGYVGDGNPEGKKFAVGVIEGDARTMEEYSEDYYVNIHAVPVGDVDDVFESAFAVSTYSKNVKRSMEIITYLNTDETLRTILQYGVEGVNWSKQKVNGEDTIKILNDTYSMNIVDTGNVYLTYPGDGIPMSDWKYSMQQNLDSAPNPYVGFEFITEENEPFFNDLAKKSASVYQEIQGLSADRVDKRTSELARQYIQDSTVGAGLLSEDSEDLTETLIFLYKQFVK